MCSVAQRGAQGRGVKIVRLRDADIVELAARDGFAVKKAIELFRHREKGRVGEEAVHDPDAVVDVISNDQFVTRVADGLEVAGRDVTGSPDKCKTLHY